MYQSNKAEETSSSPMTHEIRVQQSDYMKADLGTSPSSEPEHRTNNNA